MGKNFEFIDLDCFLNKERKSQDEKEILKNYQLKSSKRKIHILQ